MNYVGSLYGMKVFLDDNIMETCTKFTKKQTRKFKNTRWVKKYIKKYSYLSTKPSMNIVKNYEMMIMHPLTWDSIKTKANEINLTEN